MELRLITTKEIDISHYRSKSADMKKLMFKDVKVLSDDPNKQQKIVVYSEYAILGEPITKDIYKTDEFGNNILDENGNPIVLETKTIDNIKFLGQIDPQAVSYDTWFGLQKAVFSQLPDTMSEKEKYIEFLKEGIKQTIANEGYYKGQLTINDFE